MARSRLRDLVLVGSAVAGTLLSAKYLDRIKLEDLPQQAQQANVAQVAQIPKYFSKIEDIPASSPGNYALFHSALYSLNYYVVGIRVSRDPYKEGSYFYKFLEQLAEKEIDSELGAYTREIINLHFKDDKNPKFQELRSRNKKNVKLSDIEKILRLTETNPRALNNELINPSVIIRLQEEIALNIFDVQPAGKNDTYTQDQKNETLNQAIRNNLFYEDLRDLDPKSRGAYKGNELWNETPQALESQKAMAARRLGSQSNSGSPNTQSLEDVTSSYHTEDPEQDNPTYYPETHRRPDGVLQTDSEDVKGTIPLDVIIDNFHIFKEGKARITTELRDENGGLIERHPAETSSARTLVKVTDDEDSSKILNRKDWSTVDVIIEGIDQRGNPITQTYTISHFDLSNSDKGEIIGVKNDVYVEDEFFKVDSVELEDNALTIRVEVKDNQ